MPIPPTNLVATATDVRKITITWTNPTSYNLVELWYKASGSAWHAFPEFSGSVESYVDGVDLNDTMTYKVRGWAGDSWSNFSNEDSAICVGGTEAIFEDTVNVTDIFNFTFQFGDEFLETISVEDSLITEISHTLTDTVTVSDALLGSQTIRVDFGYYLGDNQGRIFETSEDYKGDFGSTVITSFWQSKVIDFTDLYPTLLDKWKTVYAVKLHYVDLEEIDVTIKLSVDGGATWTSQTKTIGNGSEVNKTAKYHMIVTGQQFIVRIDSGTSDRRFRWNGIVMEFEEGGDYYELA